MTCLKENALKIPSTNLKTLAIGAEKPERTFPTRHCDFAHILTELNTRQAVDFREFENTTQRWLTLACDQMCADAETVDFVHLIVQAQYCLFVYIIRSDNCQFRKPGQVIPFSGLKIRYRAMGIETKTYSSAIFSKTCRAVFER